MELRLPKFELATMGESVKGSDGPMAQSGSGNGHYGGKAEVYMDVGEAMGQAMVELLKGDHRSDQNPKPGG
jgi:hypothetical protein